MNHHDQNTKKCFVPRLTCKIQENGFLTVLIMRLTFLPFDLVGYSSGMCNIKQRDFALATVIGTIPGLLTFFSDEIADQTKDRGAFDCLGKPFDFEELKLVMERAILSWRPLQSAVL